METKEEEKNIRWLHFSSAIAVEIKLKTDSQ